MIYIIGDTHCPFDIKKLDNDVVKQACGGVFPQYVIITGDAGFIWYNNPENEEEVYYLNKMNQKPWITLFADGNHENFNRLNALPTVSMFGGKVGQISDRLFHLKRGEVFTIEDKKFFVLGGAMSTDKENRTAYIDWWPEEVPSYADYMNGMRNVHRHNNCVDYVISHTAPSSILKKYFPFSERYKDSTSEMLQAFIELKFKKWYFGHFHCNKNNGIFYCVFDKGEVIN